VTAQANTDIAEGQAKVDAAAADNQIPEI